MSVAYAIEGSCNTIVVKQDAAAIETITLLGSKVNDGSAYSVLGGVVQVITGAVGATIDIKVSGVSILAAPQGIAAAGSKVLILNDNPALFSGVAGADITIISSGVTKCLVTLYLSQNALTVLV